MLTSYKHKKAKGTETNVKIIYKFNMGLGDFSIGEVYMMKPNSQ